MIITKYFNAEANWDHYASGSFKIGTLEEYRGTEGAIWSRMSDTGEGTLYQAFGSGSGHIERAQTRGALIENYTFSDCDTGVAISSEINEHVFCASRGSTIRVTTN